MFKNRNPMPWKHTAATKPDWSKTAFEAHFVVVAFHPCAALKVLVHPPPLSVTALSASAIFFWASAPIEKVRCWVRTNSFDLNISNSHGLRSRNRLCCTLPSTEIPREKSRGNSRKLKQHGHTFSSASSCHLGGGGARGSGGILESGGSPGGAGGGC
jgi:hypothetical protein